jgi:uncharacterized protein (DUF2062 family)
LPKFLSLKKFFHSKLIAPLLNFLKQGMTAEKVALTLALGLCIGIMPLIGLTTGLLAILAFVFRLNMLALQAINYTVYLVQIVLFVPFLKLGQFIFQLPALPFNLNNIIDKFKASFIDTFLSVWQINLMGIVVWMLFAIPLGLAIYHLSLPFFTKHKQRIELEMEMG